MSVTGNRPPPYHREGTASCLANIRRDCEKLRLIVGETTIGYRQAMAAQALGTIETMILVIEHVDTGEVAENDKTKGENS